MSVLWAALAVDASVDHASNPNQQYSPPRIAGSRESCGLIELRTATAPKFGEYTPLELWCKGVMIVPCRTYAERGSFRSDGRDREPVFIQGIETGEELDGIGTD